MMKILALLLIGQMEQLLGAFDKGYRRSVDNSFEKILS